MYINQYIIQMEHFNIDRQFGQPIMIDVEKGIVHKVYNDEEMSPAMNKKYKGKTITFLKKDFEASMKPCYHNVRCTATLTAYQQISAVKSKIRNINILLSSGGKTTYMNKDMNAKAQKETKELEAFREKLTVELSSYEKYLKEEKERIFAEHRFVVK